MDGRARPEARPPSPGKPARREVGPPRFTLVGQLPSHGAPRALRSVGPPRRSRRRAARGRARPRRAGRRATRRAPSRSPMGSPRPPPSARCSWRAVGSARRPSRARSSGTSSSGPCSSSRPRGRRSRLDGSLDGRAFPVVYVAVGLVSAFAQPLGVHRRADLRRRAGGGGARARVRRGHAVPGAAAPRLHARLRGAEPRLPPRGDRPHPPRLSRAPRRRDRAPPRRRAQLPAPRGPGRRAGLDAPGGRGSPGALRRRGDPPVGALRAAPPARVAQPLHRDAALAERRRHAPAHQRAVQRRAEPLRGAVPLRRRHLRRGDLAARGRWRWPASSRATSSPTTSAAARCARCWRSPSSSTARCAACSSSTGSRIAPSRRASRS